MAAALRQRKAPCLIDKSRYKICMPGMTERQFCTTIHLAAKNPAEFRGFFTPEKVKVSKLGLKKQHLECSRHEK